MSIEEKNDRSADPIDHATNVAQQILDAELWAARGKSAPETHPDFDGVHCVEEDCGVEIPTARLALGRVRCIDCQTLIERRRSMHR